MEWEYMTTTIQGLPDQGWLNDLGRERWELVIIMPDWSCLGKQYFLYFKRSVK
jgi:hypothetical protein